MFYLVIALLIWASSFTAGKYAYQMFDPALVVELRLLIAMLLLGERMTLLTALGSVLVIASAAASTLIPILRQKPQAGE